MTKTNGEVIFSFFPTPYPDETLYSVLCRLHLRLGHPSYRQLNEKIFERPIILNTYVPQGIGNLALCLPENAMLTPEYLIRQTTAFPYFTPFLSQERKNSFFKYIEKEDISKRNSFPRIGAGRLRQPKNLYLRFCESCWREDNQAWGEPYWHRVHQLPGVLICHQHGEPLRDSPVLITLANRKFYPASLDMIEKSNFCDSFKDNMLEKLALLSRNSQWLLENGHLYGPYDQVYIKYGLWFYNAGFASLSGRKWLNKIYHAVNELYSRELLKLVGAYDYDIAITWIKRILFYPSRLQHPMYHILLHILLAGSTSEFLNGYCQEPLPYGKGPWPCRNTVCPHNLEDVIENIDIRYIYSLPKALFKCPYCGFAYRRQHPIPKEKQYTGKVNVESYGNLWQQKLREYFIEQGLSATRTGEYLQCSRNTVKKYAVKLGYVKSDDVTGHEKKYVPKPKQNPKPVLTESEKRIMWRQTWKQLLTENPGASRTSLKRLAPSCYKWLWENDRLWFDKHLPASQNTHHYDWAAHDSEILERVQEAVNIFRNATDRPIRITLHRIALHIGIVHLRKKYRLIRMPKTSAFISESVETIDVWRKRKIIWAINVLRESNITITLCKILDLARIDYRFAHELNGFILENLKYEENL
ncbi:MAG: TnsD family transposase [Oscillospiraceae bacterium]|nr:TnsD family transposase [Oscillospiraceae bacterium]